MLNPVDFVFTKMWAVRSLLGKHHASQFETAEFSESERTESDLHRLFYGNEGSVVHKWKHYLSIYDRHLSIFRNKKFRLLEIGVFQGGSLRLWRNYFGPDATIFGIDIDPACAVSDGQVANVRIGSQADPLFLKRVVAEMGGLDVVIDDGSHISSDQLTSFKCLFPCLAEGGIYICEDLHTNYWRGWLEGGYRRRSTFIENCKRLIDDMHHEFHSHTSSPLAKEIAGIHFYNSMVVIDKASQKRPSHIKIGSAK